MFSIVAEILQEAYERIAILERELEMTVPLDKYNGVLLMLKSDDRRIKELEAKLEAEWLDRTANTVQYDLYDFVLRKAMAADKRIAELEAEVGRLKQWRDR